MPAGLQDTSKPKFFGHIKSGEHPWIQTLLCAPVRRLNHFFLSCPKHALGVGFEELALLNEHARFLRGYALQENLMLFRFIRTDNAFQRALRAAVASHRPVALRTLLTSHGEQVFAKALSDLSGRVIADALSMLNASDRASVLSHLPRTARHRLCEAASDREFPSTQLNVPSWSLLMTR